MKGRYSCFNVFKLSKKIIYLSLRYSTNTVTMKESQTFNLQHYVVNVGDCYRHNSNTLQMQRRFTCWWQRIKSVDIAYLLSSERRLWYFLFFVETTLMKTWVKLWYTSKGCHMFKTWLQYPYLWRLCVEINQK